MPQFDLGPFTATDRVKMEVQPPEGYEDGEICDRCELEKADGAKLITYVNDEHVGQHAGRFGAAPLRLRERRDAAGVPGLRPLRAHPPDIRGADPGRRG